jgi:hypothetical protein
MFPAVALLAFLALSQAPGESSGRILETALASPGAHATLVELCRTAPHRLAGSEGAEKAVAWAREAMQKIGLENVRLEPCTVQRWERGSLAQLEVLGPASARDVHLPILALGGSVGTPAPGLAAEVLLVRSFDELAQKAESARGKLVFFDRPMDPRALDPFEARRAVDQRSRGAIEAARRGGVDRALDVARSTTIRTDALRGRRRARPAAGEWRARSDSRRSSRGASVRLRLRLDCRDAGEVPRRTSSASRGSRSPEEIVLVGPTSTPGRGQEPMTTAGCAQVIRRCGS